MTGENDNGKKRKPLIDKAAEDAKVDAIYGVGYRRPPASKQFQKGQSGNPKGRPRGVLNHVSFGDQSLLKAVLAKSNELVSVRSGDTVKKITMNEAAVESIAAHAVKGNARSQGLWVDLTRTAEAANALEIERQNVHWNEYKEKVGLLFAQARERGEPEPDRLPHPDDVVIEWTEAPRFLGPTDEDGQRRMEETMRFRDVLLMQDVWDNRSATRLDSTPLTKSGAALLEAHILERALPPRLRRSNGETIWFQRTYYRMTKRELAKTLYWAWRRLGRPRPRGYVSVDQSVMEKKLRLVFDFVSAASSGELDIEALATGKIDDAARDFFAEHGCPIDETP